MAGTFLDCYRVVVISKKSEKKKRKKKNMKGGKGNEEEGKMSPFLWNLCCCGDDDQECSHWQPMRLNLILAMTKIVMVVGTVVTTIKKTTQTIAIMTKRNFTPLYMKPSFR